MFFRVDTLWFPNTILNIGDKAATKVEEISQAGFALQDDVASQDKIKFPHKIGKIASQDNTYSQ